MYPANITRAEAAERSAQDRTHSYDVLVDLSGRVPDAGEFDPTATFVSTSTVRFTSRRRRHLRQPDRRPAARRRPSTGRRWTTTPFDDHTAALRRRTPGDHELVITALCRYSRTGEGLHRFVDPVDDRVYLLHPVRGRRRPPRVRLLRAARPEGDLHAHRDRARRPGRCCPTPPPSSPIAARRRPGRAGSSPPPRRSPPTSPPWSPASSTSCTTASRGHGGRDPAVAAVPAVAGADHLDADRIFATTKRGFAVFEEHFGMPYPFADYAQVFVPEFNAGAMENAGCVTIRDEYLFRSPRHRGVLRDPRQHDPARAGAHVVRRPGHHDLVGRPVAQRVVRRVGVPLRPGRDPRRLRRPATTRGRPSATSRKTWAYRQDQLPSTHPIAADMVDLEAVELNFDGITYAKGASVLRQLVAFVGQDDVPRRRPRLLRRARLGQHPARRPAGRAGGGVRTRPVALRRRVAADRGREHAARPSSTPTTTAASPASRSGRPRTDAVADAAPAPARRSASTTEQDGRLVRVAPRRGRHRRRAHRGARAGRPAASRPDPAQRRRPHLRQDPARRRGRWPRWSAASQTLDSALSPGAVLGRHLGHVPRRRAAAVRLRRRWCCAASASRPT